MATLAEVELLDDGRLARLSRDGETCDLRLVSPADARFEILPATPPQPDERQNTFYRLLVFMLELPAGEAAFLQVSRLPGEGGAGVPNLPLAMW